MQKNDDRDWKIQLNKWLKGRQVYLNFILYVSTLNSLVLSGIHDGISIFVNYLLPALLPTTLLWTVSIST